MWKYTVYYTQYCSEDSQLVYWFNFVINYDKPDPRNKRHKLTRVAYVPSILSIISLWLWYVYFVINDNKQISTSLDAFQKMYYSARL